MKVCKRILAGLALLLAIVMLLLSLAGGLGVWIVKEPATAKATHVFERIEAALKIADQGLGHVKTSLDRAAESLDSVKEDQRELARRPQAGAALGSLMARKVQRTLAPELGNANEKLHTVAEAAVVVNAILEDVGSFPFLSVVGLDLDRLTEMNSRLADVAPAAWRLSRLLGEPAPDSDAAGNTQLSLVEGTLKAMQGFVAEYQPRVAEVRQRTEDLKSRIFFWITPASVLVSLICFWIALSQISILFHIRSWWKR
jgi:hypothetical protein